MATLKAKLPAKCPICKKNFPKQTDGSYVRYSGSSGWECAKCHIATVDLRHKKPDVKKVI